MRGYQRFFILRQKQKNRSIIRLKENLNAETLSYPFLIYSFHTL
jgi:hypothetical protein